VSQSGTFTISTLPPGMVVETLTGNTGGVVGPNGADNINIIGDGTTVQVSGNPSTNTLTISAIGSGEVSTLTGNSGGAISPLAGNIGIEGDGVTITITGNPSTHILTASVISGVIAESFETDSGAATPVLGVLNIIGGKGITTSGTSNTVTVSSTGIFFTYVDVNMSPYFVLEDDVYLSVDSSGGPITLLFPDAAFTGEPYIVKDRTGNAAANNISITTVSGIDTIDGVTFFVMDSAYQSVSLIGNGTSYEIY